MDDSEKLALQYLRSRGHSSVVFEPDGNVSPDFLVDGRVAVEVRRLNQNEVSESGDARGLETMRFGLLGMISELLDSLGPSRTGESWFVCFTFARPVLRLPTMRRRVRKVLEAFRDGMGVPRSASFLSRSAFV
jgi:hypothetical protein